MSDDLDKILAKAFYVYDGEYIGSFKEDTPIGFNIKQEILDWHTRHAASRPTLDSGKLKTLFNELCDILGHQNLKYTPARGAKLRKRLQTFTSQEIMQAAKAIADNEYLMGDNPSGKKYGTVDYLIRNDEKLDEWLESARGSGDSVDLRSIEI